MRFLRRTTVNPRDPRDYRLYVDVTSNVAMTGRASLQLPKGSTSDRPVAAIPTSLGATPGLADMNGMIRYNTTTDEVEVFQSGTWRALRFKENSGITQQSLGSGDASTVYFGPLNPAPPTTVQSGAAWGPQNLIVLIENVPQISTTNYTVEQNPTIAGVTYVPKVSYAASLSNTTLYFNSAVAGVGASGNGATVTLTFAAKTQTPFAVGSSIIVTGFVPSGYNGTYTVTASTNSSVSYASSTVGVPTVTGTITSADAVYPSVDITGASITGSGSIPGATTISTYTVDSITNALVSITFNNALTGPIAVNTSITLTDTTNTASGYFVKFTSPPPYGKPITVLHGFDK